MQDFKFFFGFFGHKKQEFGPLEFQIISVQHLPPQQCLRAGRSCGIHIPEGLSLSDLSGFELQICFELDISTFPVETAPKWERERAGPQQCNKTTPEPTESLPRGTGCSRESQEIPRAELRPWDLGEYPQEFPAGSRGDPSLWPGFHPESHNHGVHPCPGVATLPKIPPWNLD